MSKITFAWWNLADKFPPAVSSAKPSLPAKFLNTPDITQKWRSNGDNSVTITLAFGTAMAVGVVALINTNLSEGATIRITTADGVAVPVPGSGPIELNLIDLGSDGLLYTGTANDYIVWRPTVTGTGGTDSGLLPVKLDRRTGNLIAWFPQIVTTGIELVITDHSVDYIEAGRLVVAGWDELSYNFQFGSQELMSDVSPVTESLGRQTWVDQRPERDGWQFNLQFTSVEAQRFRQMIRWLRSSKDMLVCIDRDDDNPAEMTMWALIQQPLPSLVTSAPNYWTASMQVLERK